MVVVNSSIRLVNSRCSNSHRILVHSHGILVDSRRIVYCSEHEVFLGPYIVSSGYMEYVII